MPQDKDKKDSADIRMKGFKEKKDVIDFLTIIDEKISPSNISEVVCLNEAAGRVLASSIISTVKVPNFNRSAMDGYAIRGEETFGAGRQASCLRGDTGGNALHAHVHLLAG